MEIKKQSNINTWLTIFSLLIGLGGLGLTWYTINQGMVSEMYQKEADLVTKIQEVKDVSSKNLNSHINDFQDFKLKDQEINSNQDNKINNLEHALDHNKNQYEHLHSQSKADNQVLEADLKEWVDRNFKRK